MSENANDPNKMPWDGPTCDANMERSRRAFGGAKKAAAEAIGHLHICYKKILGSASTPETRAWLERKINEHNIRVSNGEGIVSGGDRRKLVKLDVGSDEDGRRRAFVRLFAELYREGDESHGSRVNRALEWTLAKPELKPARTADDVVNEVKAAGGFEEIVRQGRGHDPKPNAKLSAAASAQVATELEQAAKAAPAKLVANTTGAYTLGDGTHLALIREGAGTLEVIDHSPVDLNRDGPLLKRFKTGLLPPPPIKGEFLRRISMLSAVVPEGGMTMLTEGDVWNGTPLLEERAFSLRGNAGRPADVVISARHVDAAPVVVFEPAEALGMPHATHATRSMLPGRSWEGMEKVLAVPDIERVIDAVFLPAAATSTVVWEVYLPADADKKQSNRSDKTRVDIVWEAMQPGTWRPLEVNGFEAIASASASATDLDALKAGITEGEAAAKADSNKGKVPVAHLVCHADTLDVVLGPNIRRTLKLKSKLAEPLRVFVRLTDLRAAVNVLVDCSVQQVELAIDSGAISLTWTDRLGTQAIFLPALSTGGGLLATRFRQMAAPPSLVAETASVPA
jgi:hypothetical protein